MNKFAIKYDGKIFKGCVGRCVASMDNGVELMRKDVAIGLLLSGDAELVPDPSYREAIIKRLDQLLKEIEEIRNEVSK